MNNEQISVHARVSGKVQGVYFRQSTQQKAHALQLTGWVKNNSDGSVELMASGLREALMQLQDWLWQGPLQAEVKNVEWREVAFEKFENFRIV